MVSTRGTVDTAVEMMSLLVIFIVIGGVFQFCDSVTLPDHWKKYLSWLENYYTQNPMLCLPQIMLPNQLILVKGNEEGQGLVSLIPYLPLVIIWNPLQQYPIYFPRGIKCPICEERLFIRSWNTGKDISTQPRILHDIDCVVLLVGLYYSCSNKHNIISYDLRLLCLILDKTEIPFSLSYRTGFTN